MSNLTAHDWAVDALDQLKVAEQNCAEQDLFCVGYLIPQVVLVEVKYSDQSASPEQWQRWLIEYVQGNIVADKLQLDDSKSIEKLMAAL